MRRNRSPSGLPATSASSRRRYRALRKDTRHRWCQPRLADTAAWRDASSRRSPRHHQAIRGHAVLRHCRRAWPPDARSGRLLARRPVSARSGRALVTDVRQVNALSRRHLTPISSRAPRSTVAIWRPRRAEHAESFETDADGATPIPARNTHGRQHRSAHSCGECRALARPQDCVLASPAADQAVARGVALQRANRRCAVAHAGPLLDCRPRHAVRGDSPPRARRPHADLRQGQRVV
jgi:hypothetical protein